MTYDFTNKSDREKLHELVKQTIDGHRNNIKLELTVNSLKCIERLIETQERIIEDQEERIAIMTEGGNDKKVSILQSELYNCRNELCIKCGLYRRSHEGVCNGCRYRHDGEWKEGLE